MEKKTTGAWLIHHTTKLQQVTNPAFDRIALAGKAGMLLSALSESQDSTLKKKTIEAIARAAGISPVLELPTLLTKLEENQLLNRSQSGDIYVLGLTTASVLTHTSDIFHSVDPEPKDFAVLELAELASHLPVNDVYAAEYLGDGYKLPKNVVQNILLDSEEIGFIDSENIDKDRKLYFNGNLFRREDAQKITAILASLNPAELRSVQELEDTFKNTVCVSYDRALQIVGESVLKRLQSIGMYDVNGVSNEVGSSYFLTKPAAFGKYGNALVEDALDLAKVFVTSLSYGMTRSSAGRGRITMLPALMRKLLRGEWVGPATAIGQDYKVLELKRVIQVNPATSNTFYMRLLKKDVGELAFQAIREGDVSEASLPLLPSASIIDYSGPERNREHVRRKQTSQAKREVVDILRTLRTGESL